MKVGIIGIGIITMDYAYRAAEAGYEVIISNPRGNSIIRDCTKNGR